MTAQLLALLHLCDSLFPLGTFAHSDGLEAATSRGSVGTAADLAGWIDVTLDQGLRRAEGPAVCRAWRAFRAGDCRALRAVDDELFAMRPASTMRDASRAIGGRLIRTWLQLQPTPPLRLVAEECPSLTLPTAFGVVTAAASIAERDAIAGFLYTRLAGVVSASMRLMPIGQQAAHRCLTNALERLPSIVNDIVGSDTPLQSFSPAMDLAMMSQQYGHSRMFRS